MTDEKRFFITTIRSVIVGGFLWAALTGCANRGPVLLGFSGELTGRRGDLGVAARDGAQLAVDEINQQGGINGRPLKLIIKDDQGDPVVAQQVDRELIDTGVVAIIGHITSAQTAATLNQANQAKVVLFSPASASHLFSGQKDYFFRNQPSTELMGKALALYIRNTYHISQLLVIYDTENQAFAEPLWQTVDQEFVKLGGNATQKVPFSSKEADLRELVSRVGASKPEAVLFISSPVDTALLIQYAHQLHLETKVFSSTWAVTSELLEKGGQAIEGLELAAVYDPQNSLPAFQTFTKNFEARYKRKPDFLALYGYEAVLIIAHALGQTGGNAEDLPEALVKIKNLAGPQGEISMNDYGDVNREIYIVRVKGNRFETVTAIQP